MTTEAEGAGFELRQLRLRHMAQGGVQVAVSVVSKALGAGQVPPGKLEPFTLPVYRLARGGQAAPLPGELIASEDLQGTVQVTIMDECALVNLNHAPTRVIEAILGVDGSTARKIRSSLPRAAEGEEVLVSAPAGQRRYLVSVDELLTRGLIDEAAFRKINKELVTVCSVRDSNNPVGYINLNSASPEVLSAVLGITAEAAKALASKRPLTSWAEVGPATGVDPATFTLRSPPEAPDAPPSPIGFQSRCYRVRSEAVLTRQGDEAKAVRSRVEAVIWFGEGQRPEILSWSEVPATTPAPGVT
jgi:DNA uptake protein ComE-like DNA-binding protein